jgi:hypothetical protein
MTDSSTAAQLALQELAALLAQRLLSCTPIYFSRLEKESKPTAQYEEPTDTTAAPSPTSFVARLLRETNHLEGPG